jgi:hypothetical protein
MEHTRGSQKIWRIWAISETYEDREKKLCFRSYSNIIVAEHESGSEEGFCYIGYI